LGEAVQQAGITAPSRFFDQTGSTNLEARNLAERGAPEWTVVAAGHQTAGRGRMGRSWASAPGKALQFSLVLRPGLMPADAPLAALLAAAEMAHACLQVAGVRVVSKWPNDLLAGERKLGGILPEAKVSSGALEYLILGIGVNVSMGDEDFPGELARTATSLLLEGGAGAVAYAELLGRFLAGFRASWQGGDGANREDILRRYRAICATLGRRVRATTVEGTVVEGAASDLDEHGGLRIGDETVAFGEVLHLD
jgi:BirA family transcriptional regulator, biotin operon repressor / biotin---[acetyl-CoA-carboxylase] ligase